MLPVKIRSNQETKVEFPETQQMLKESNVAFFVYDLRAFSQK